MQLYPSGILRRVVKSPAILSLTARENIGIGGQESLRLSVESIRRAW